MRTEEIGLAETPSRLAPAAPGPLRDFVLYSVIGATGVLVDLAAFWLLYEVFGLPAQCANALSTTFGITNNFTWNALFTFRRRDRLLRRFCRFYLVGLAGMAVTSILLFLFSGVLHVDPNLVKAASLPAVLIVQYVLNRTWSFS
ncbi:GtrA family protein [Streptomyces jeddahensis]|uniref:GtrA-like protein n=1 Tax=Streptomyces jeddahensis TaxID=1716141 RepID=A0A177HJ03_9ACTN|nr:GtrA family protein [Streptomyces jeddahensis]OAH10118.1 GtrA-like protein [Streptomyces jeddahensis]